ncbi:MAG: type II secretion system F family protein [Proteocatella sp.]
MEILILMSVAVVGYSVAYMILYILKGDRIEISKRLDKFISKSKDENLKIGDKKNKGLRLWKGTRSFASDKLKMDLQSAGILMKPEEFIIGWFALALLPMALTLMIADNLMLSLAVAVIGAIIPPIIVIRAKDKRLELFSKQLGEALPIIGNSLRSGFTFQQSMENVYNNMPDPLAYEFGKTIREMRYGIPFEEAIGRLGKRMSNKDLNLLISAVIIQGKVGGNLAEIIDIIGETIKDRVKIKRDIKTMTSAGKLSGLILGLLPVVLAVALSIMNPGYLSGFFTSSLGMIMLAVAAVMETIGFIVILKMTDIKF